MITFFLTSLPDLALCMVYLLTAREPKRAISEVYYMSEGRDYAYRISRKDINEIIIKNEYPYVYSGNHGYDAAGGIFYLYR